MAEEQLPPTTRHEEIIAAAMALLETHGYEHVTMRAVADAIGIRAPSLYKHLASKHELEVAMIAEGFLDMAARFNEALASAPDPLEALAVTYRRWAVTRPHLYRLMTHRPLPRQDLPEGVEQAAAAPVVAVVGGDGDAARALWAFAHGMASLEIAGRFPDDADLDAAWRMGLGAFRHLVPTP